MTSPQTPLDLLGPDQRRVWGGLRLVVVDVETTGGSREHGHRVVSIGVVTCRAGRVRGQWESILDPGVPIQPVATRVHGLTDAHVAGEPRFGDIADQLLVLLSGHTGERVVLCAHNATFDIPVLRSELARVERELPDLAVLDTSRHLPALAGVAPARRSLTALLDCLGLRNDRPHSALGDALATAEAALALLDSAAVGRDLDGILEAAGTTTARLEFAGPGHGDGTHEAAAPSAAHMATHRRVLGRGTAAATLASASRALTECAAARCPHLIDRVASATTAPEVLLSLLTDTLDARVAAHDIAGVATVLPALGPLLPALPALTGKAGRRRAALGWYDQRNPALAALGRCGPTDLCPACRHGQACGLDSWLEPLAAAALADNLDNAARGFFETTGREAGTGVYTRWRTEGREGLADAALSLVASHWTAVGQDSRAAQVAALGLAAGCTHPRLAVRHASALAAGGRAADLRAGLAVCRQVLRGRGGNTADGWAELTERTSYLDGRLERLTVRYTGEVDEDGNPVPVRRHHPEDPRRVLQPRFLRGV